MQQGMQKGIQEGRLEMARAFKQKGVDIGIIADTSGIPIERVKML
jgi:predicted transposase YdaD